jgi:hypothetical protein
MASPKGRSKRKPKSVHRNDYEVIASVLMAWTLQPALAADAAIAGGEEVDNDSVKTETERREGVVQRFALLERRARMGQMMGVLSAARALLNKQEWPA